MSDRLINLDAPDATSRLLSEKLASLNAAEKQIKFLTAQLAEARTLTETQARELAQEKQDRWRDIDAMRRAENAEVTLAAQLAEAKARLAITIEALEKIANRPPSPTSALAYGALYDATELASAAIAKAAALAAEKT